MIPVSNFLLEKFGMARSRFKIGLQEILKEIICWLQNAFNPASPLAEECFNQVNDLGGVDSGSGEDLDCWSSQGHDILFSSLFKIKFSRLWSGLIWDC